MMAFISCDGMIIESTPSSRNRVWRNIDNLRYADDTTLTAESKEKLKSLLMRVKEESDKADLELSIKNPKIMASDPITSWQVDGDRGKQ